LETAAARILNGLADRGWNVTLFYLRCDATSERFFSNKIVRVQVRSRFLPKVPGFNPKLRDAIAILPQLLIHLIRARPWVILSFQSTTACLAVAGPLGVPVVHRESLDVSRAMGGQPFQHRMVMGGKRLAYRACAAIITNSDGSRRSLARVSGVPRAAIELIYNPVDPAALATLADQPLPPGPVSDAFATGLPVFVATGRLATEKDHATLLKAFAALSAKREARLVVGGAGGRLESLRQLSEMLGIADRVVFAGHLQNPYPVVARAAAYVLSSRTEGLPNALLEAVALGVPAVSTECPSGPREILCEGAGGLLVPVGDSAALSDALGNVLDDPAAARARAQRASQNIERFLPDTVIAQYAAVLARASGDRP
jgi:glycosyltransferase involved in cell wall biosynthesis